MLTEADAMWKMLRYYSIQYLYDNCEDIHIDTCLHAFMLNKAGLLEF